MFFTLQRQTLEEYNSDDEERATDLDYKPQVVVLRAGDLTEEEAEREKQRLLRGSLLLLLFFTIYRSFPPWTTDSGG